MGVRRMGWEEVKFKVDSIHMSIGRGKGTRVVRSSKLNINRTPKTSQTIRLIRQSEQGRHGHELMSRTYAHTHTAAAAAADGTHAGRS